MSNPEDSLLNAEKYTLNSAKVRLPRALIVAVHLDGVSDTEFNSSLVELAELAKTLGLDVVGQFTPKRASFYSTAYMGVGKRQEIREFTEAQQEAADRLMHNAPHNLIREYDYAIRLQKTGRETQQSQSL